MSLSALTNKIRDFALSEAGFDLIGFSPAVLPSVYKEATHKWVEDGFAGSMEYMVRDNGAKRAHPEASLASARSVISLAVNYFHPEDSRPNIPVGKVAKYAYGEDYHKLIEKKLKKLKAFVMETAGPGTEVKSYVDTGPILEKAFAKESGLAFFGKNTNVITREFGSWVFLASLITNLELDYGTPHPGACGTCRLCIDACPTGALLGDYRMDARRCISYLTIEAKEEVPVALKKGIGEWIFGCDICQEVCPYNFRAKTTRHTELYPQKKAGSWISLESIESLADGAAFATAFQGSPVKRPKLSGLKRNANIVKGNLSLRGGEADEAISF